MKLGPGWQHNDQRHPFEPEAGGEGHKPDPDAREPGFASLQVGYFDRIPDNDGF